jgi:putative aminopeptidase FrvX
MFQRLKKNTRIRFLAGGGFEPKAAPKKHTQLRGGGQRGARVNGVLGEQNSSRRRL